MTKTGETTQVRASATLEAGSVRERPILFSAPMVKAILDGRKTQTRRIVKVRDVALDKSVAPFAGAHFGTDTPQEFCPYGAPGDRLWVRETWQALHFTEAYSEGHSLGYCDDWDPADEIPKDSRGGFWTPVYAATDPFAQEHRDDRGFAWRPGIHMPRWASRITLEVTGVRVERLHDITEEDAAAEGIEPLWSTHKLYPSKHAAEVQTQSFRDGFRVLWDDINGKRAPWASNPWLWVVSFRRVEAP